MSLPILAFDDQRPVQCIQSCAAVAVENPVGFVMALYGETPRYLFSTDVPGSLTIQDRVFLQAFGLPQTTPHFLSGMMAEDIEFAFYDELSIDRGSIIPIAKGRYSSQIFLGVGETETPGVWSESAQRGGDTSFLASSISRFVTITCLYDFCRAGMEALWEYPDCPSEEELEVYWEIAEALQAGLEAVDQQLKEHATMWSCLLDTNLM